VPEQRPTRGGDFGDYYADLWATAEWVDYDTQYSVDMTCLEQRTDGEQVFVTGQNTRERFAGDVAEQSLLVALLPDA
jgi:hypothetical protein